MLSDTCQTMVSPTRLWVLKRFKVYRKRRLHSLVGHLTWKVRGEGPQGTLPIQFQPPWHPYNGSR